MIVGYARVSTKGQEKDGNSLADQVNKIVMRYSDAIIQKEAYTASTKERPIFSKMISDMKSGDTLVVTKLDRFCRNTKEGLEVIEMLQKKQVNIHILNMGLIENTPMGQLIVTCLLAFAEFERSQIVERTQSGKEIAKQNPYFIEGRPKKYSLKQINYALKLLDTNSYKEVELITGISKSTLIRARRKK